MMFSQLCRAKPSILWNKFGIRQQPTQTNPTQRTSDSDSNGEDRCQLEHCTFCDFRVCCQVTPCTTYDWDTECLQNTDSDAKVTENPAYGLSSKNWLEAREDDENDGRESPTAVSMEQPENSEQNLNCDTKNESPTLDYNPPPGVTTSASQRDCDANKTVPEMNQANFQQNKMELKAKNPEETSEVLPNNKHEASCCNDAKQGKLTWSVLRHRQLSGDILKNFCDNKTSSNVIEQQSTNDSTQPTEPCHPDKVSDLGFMLRTKKSGRERPFPLSLMKPIAKMGDRKPDPAPASQQHFNSHLPKNDLLSRQRPVQRYAREKFQSGRTPADKSKKLSCDILGMNNPLSDIAQIKAEESVQEWLARIGETANSGAWPEDSEDKGDKETTLQSQPWNLTNNTDEEKGRDNNSQHRPDRDDSMQQLHRRRVELSRSRERLCRDDLIPKTEFDTASVLSNASKVSPANVPMVVMQCSRLHSSHVESKKATFQQTSLPMGTLVTALYQESEWLYVQTPHGVEGFVLASNCAPIGTINEPAQARKPWEPCDFPIQVCIRNKHELGRQQGSYIPAKLPTNSNGKQAAPYVSTVKMKTNFYSDRYFSHTFKSKDSIKTAKTVTDILRSSPETKVSNQ